MKEQIKAGLGWEMDNYKVAYSEFNLGLAAEVRRRGENIEVLDRERQAFKPPSGYSPLQARASHYNKQRKKKPCARGCPLCTS